MSFDDDQLADMHVDLFDTFAIDATVARGTDAPVAVRIIVNRDLERVGDYGTVVGRVDAVDFLVAQWRPESGDLVTWVDRHGSFSKRVESQLQDDGFVARVVLHG